MGEGRGPAKSAPVKEVDALKRRISARRRQSSDVRLKQELAKQPQESTVDARWDHEMINMKRLDLEGEPFPWGVSVAYSLTPCVVGLVVLTLTGSAWNELGALVLWHIWSWHIAVYPAPVWTYRGAITSALTLFGGVLSMQQLSNKLIRTQYVMATVMFVSGRGNVLVNDSYFRHMPLSFRGAYLFSFLDLGKARYYKSLDEYNESKADLKLRLVLSTLGCCVTAAILVAMKAMQPQSYVLEIFWEPVKVLLGSVNFILGIYLGDAIYTIPLFAFAQSPLKTLKAQPLMIRPWRSETIKEWWGARFDTGMQSVLYNNAYRPTRKMGLGRGVAMMATFILSGLIHLPLIFELGAGGRELAMMFSFFIVQAFYVGLEDSLNWGPSTTRTLALLYLSAPLFTYPVMARQGFS